MTWDKHHSQSELLAAEAAQAAKEMDYSSAEKLYERAAIEETEALNFVPEEKPKTRGITAISAVALWYKAGNLSKAESLAYQLLAADPMPAFAKNHIKDLIQTIWSAQSAESAGVAFAPGDVLVSVKGGEVIWGGAPLDLILHKVEGIRSYLFRTAEMLFGYPFRVHGPPANDLQSMFKPWLFQAARGSYQFAVRIQEPVQRNLWDEERPKMHQIIGTFFSLLRASTVDPEDGLSILAADPQYRDAFLRLSRNLAPTGKTFERLEIRDASAPSETIAAFAVESRKSLNAAIKKHKPPKDTESEDKPVRLTGVLRGVQLDQDWLEITPVEGPPTPIHIEQAGDALDDVVGPMVNHRVVVDAIQRGKRYLYLDIEMDE